MGADSSTKKLKQKAIRYCDYQDRSEHEVRQKLRQWEATSSQSEEIIKQLKSLNLLNEERFATNYAKGKFRLKKWGKRKIRQGLEYKQVPSPLIDQALQQIDEQQYQATLKKLLHQKSQRINESNLFYKRGKTARYAIQKGYAPALVWSMVKNILPKE